MVMSHRNGTDPGTFTVLVLGILIALAVDDWMQGRRDARMEREYLPLLVRDLRRDEEILKEFMDFEARPTSDGIMAYRALRTSVAYANKEAVVSALSRLSARAPEYEVLVGNVWQRTSVSFQAIINVKVIVEQSAGSRAAIAAELAGRRWPD